MALSRSDPASPRRARSSRAPRRSGFAPCGSCRGRSAPAPDGSDRHRRRSLRQDAVEQRVSPRSTRPAAAAPGRRGDRYRARRRCRGRRADAPAPASRGRFETGLARPAAWPRAGVDAHATRRTRRSAGRCASTMPSAAGKSRLRIATSHDSSRKRQCQSGFGVSELPRQHAVRQRLGVRQLAAPHRLAGLVVVVVELARGSGARGKHEEENEKRGARLHAETPRRQGDHMPLVSTSPALAEPPASDPSAIRTMVRRARLLGDQELAEEHAAEFRQHHHVVVNLRLGKRLPVPPNRLHDRGVNGAAGSNQLAERRRLRLCR